MNGKLARITAAGALTLAIGSGIVGASPASASHGGRGDVTKTGMCSGSSDWKLKLSPDDGRIEVEFEVDSNKVGQTWHVRILENGSRIFSGNRVTKAPSGSFTVRKLADNPPGTDSFTARATNTASGETCIAHASI
jgi:hypothetical protein